MLASKDSFSLVLCGSKKTLTSIASGCLINTGTNPESNDQAISVDSEGKQSLLKFV